MSSLIAKKFFLFTKSYREFISYLENLNVPLVNYFITLVGIITLRNFVESFSHDYRLSLFYSNFRQDFLTREFFHFELAYLAIAFLLLIALHYFTKEKIQSIIKVLVPLFILILLAPLVDLIVTLGKGAHIGYLFPSIEHGLWYYYFTFFHSAPTITFGMRFEMVIVLICTLFYLYIKQKNIILVCLGALVIYSLIFFVIATPYVLQYFSFMLHLDIPLNASSATSYFLSLLFLLGVAVSFLADRRVFLVILKDFRWLRLWHYESMLLLGIALAAKKFDVSLIPNLIFLSIGVMFFWLFSIIINNIADQDIDCISNPMRPLITKEIDLEQYTNIAYVILGCGLIYTLAVNFASFLMMCGIIFIGHIYSVPPLRLKRVLYFSKTLIAFDALMIVGLGYFNVQGGWEGFPRFFIWFFLLGFSSTINLIDIKDYEGDKAGGILTLPVLLGLDKAKILIGFSFILTSGALYFYLQSLYLLPFLLFGGVLGFYFINQKKYQEWKVFCVYLCSIAGIISWIFVRNICY